MYLEIAERCKMKKVLLFLFVFSLLSFVCAEQMICVDFDKPSAPSNLETTISGQNVILTWEPAIDTPNCSGIDYYVISRGEVIIAENITKLTYTDANINFGTYSYSVYAVDKVAHIGEKAIKNNVILSESTVTIVSSSSSSSGSSYKKKSVISTPNSTNTSTIVLSTNENLQTSGENKKESDLNEDIKRKSLFSRITGSAILTEKGGGTFKFLLGAIVLVCILIIVFIFTKRKRKNNFTS
jgi:hypothetical protein